MVRQTNRGPIQRQLGMNVLRRKLIENFTLSWINPKILNIKEWDGSCAGRDERLDALNSRHRGVELVTVAVRQRKAQIQK